MSTIVSEPVLADNSRRVARIYLGIAVTLALVALMLLLAVSGYNRGPGLRSTGALWLPSLASFVDSFGSMLALAALGASLGSTQTTVAENGMIVRAATAWCFGGCAIAWGFVGACLLNQAATPGRPWWSIPILAAGILLILAVAWDAMQFLADLGRRLTRATRVWALSACLFSVAGFLGVLWSLWHLWRGGLSGVDWLGAQAGVTGTHARVAAALPPIVLWLYPHPIVVALASAGLVFGSQRRSSGHRSGLRLAMAASYAVGLALVATGLLRRVGSLHSGGFDSSFVLGLVLTSASLLWGAFQLGGDDRTPLGRVRTLAVGGASLVLLAGWHMWYTDLVRPQSAGVEALGWSHPVTAALGGLAVALSVVPDTDAGFGRLRGVSGAAFVVGAMLLAVGLYQGVGLPVLWRLDLSTTLGVALLSASLVVELVGIRGRGATPRSLRRTC